MKPQISRAACWYIPKCPAQSILPNIEAEEETEMPAEEAACPTTYFMNGFVGLLQFCQAAAFVEFMEDSLEQAQASEKTVMWQAHYEM